jgi:hypothetical protein
LKKGIMMISVAVRRLGGTLAGVLLATGAAMAAAAPANAGVGDPCDVQAVTAGAGLYAQVDVGANTLGFLRVDLLPSFECSTRTTTAPITDEWLSDPADQLYVPAVLLPGEELTWYETDMVWTPGGASVPVELWVNSAEVTLDEP